MRHLSRASTPTLHALNVPRSSRGRKCVGVLRAGQAKETVEHSDLRSDSTQ